MVEQVLRLPPVVMASTPIKLTQKELKDRLDENNLDLSMMQLTIVPLKEIVSASARMPTYAPARTVANQVEIYSARSVQQSVGIRAR
jgi:hypothetical protein